MDVDNLEAAYIAANDISQRELYIVAMYELEIKTIKEHFLFVSLCFPVPYI